MMHTEHLQSVRFGIVTAAWAVAVAVTSLLLLVVFGIGAVDADSPLATRVAIAAVALGFYAGGIFAGTRTGSAPILHGTFIGLLSLAIWFLLNGVTAVAFPDFGWQALTPNLAVGLVVLQIAAAILGARHGYRRSVR